MEDREFIREVNGIANARKVSMASVNDSDIQCVVVTDLAGEVQLSLSTSSYPAALTPSQARKVARELVESAKRVEVKSNS